MMKPQKNMFRLCVWGLAVLGCIVHCTRAEDLLSYSDVANTLVQHSYTCLQTGACTISYQNCYNHTHLEPYLPSDISPERSCRTMLGCHQQCQNEPSKASTLACEQRCHDQMDSNAILLYSILQQCFMKWCPEEYAAQECHGWTSKEECEMSSSCYFSRGACSSTDTSAPEFVNCPAKNIEVQTLSTSNTGIARWADLRAIDRGISTSWVQLDGDYKSGDQFPVGTTTLHFRSSDTATPTPNYVDCVFSVVVKDAWPPYFTHCPKSFEVYPDAEEFFVDVNGNYLLNVTWVTPTAHDYVGFSFDSDSPTTNWQAVPLGETTITYTAVDGEGHSASCIFTITVATPFPFFFDAVEEKRPEGFDYAAASIEFDLNRGYSAISDLLTQGNIIVRFTGVEVNGCAQRCYSRWNNELKCSSFLMSRDGTGKCYLLGDTVTPNDTPLEFDTSWDLYFALWSHPQQPTQQDHHAYCPGAQAANACAVKDPTVSDCDFASAYETCASEALGSSCNSVWALRLHDFRRDQYSRRCNGLETSTHPAPEDSSRCQQYEFAQCISCCKNTTSNDRCRIHIEGVLREPDVSCAQQQYSSRVECSVSCFPSRRRNIVSEEGPPDGFIDVLVEFVLDGTADVSTMDKVEEALLILALAQTFNLSHDSIIVSASVNDVGQKLIYARLRVSEDAQLPSQPPGEDALWTYIVLESVTWVSLLDDNMSIPVTPISPFFEEVENRLQIMGNGFLDIGTIDISQLKVVVNVSDTFRSPGVTVAPTEPEVTVQTSTFTTTTLPNGVVDGSASGSSENNDSQLSSGLVAVIAIMVVFIVLVGVTVYMCMRYKDRKVKVAPMAPSFSAPDPVHSLPPGQGMRPPSMVRRSQILPDSDPFLDQKVNK